MIAQPFHEHFASSPVAPPRTSHDLIRAVCLTLCLLAVYLLTYRGGFHSIDEVSMFAVTESLVKFGQVNTDQVAWTQWTTSQREAQGFFGADGHVYSKKGLVLSLAMAPLYWLGWVIPGLGMLQTASLINPIVTALTGGLLFLTVRQLGYAPGVALFTVLIGGLGTISWVYSKYLFSEPLAGLLLLGAVFAVIAFRRSRLLRRAATTTHENGRVAGRAGARRPQAGYRWAALAGLLLGLTVATRANNLFVVPLFALYLAAAGWLATPDARSIAARLLSGLRPVIWLGLGLLPPAALLLGYNWLRSGNPLQTGYDLTIFSPDILAGLYKLLLSPLRGLFVYSPVLLLCLPGAVWLWQRRRAETALLCGVSGVTLLLFAAWTSGEGLSWGSRFLVPLVPLLGLLLAPVVERAWHGAMAVAVPLAVLSLASLAIQVLGVAINPWVYLGRLQAELGGEFFLERTAALSDFRFAQIVGQLDSWSVANSDLAWWQPWGFDVPALGLSLALLVVTAAALFQAWDRRPSPGAVPGLSPPRPSVGTLPVALAVAVVASIVLPLLLLGRYFTTDRQFGPHADDPYTTALDAAAGALQGRGAIITVAPYHYHVAMNRFKGRRPLIGFAQATPPLPDTARPLLEHAMVPARAGTALVTVGLPPAAPDNAVEAWLAEAAFKAGEAWFGDARLVRYATGRKTMTAYVRITPDGQLQRVAAPAVPAPTRAGDSLNIEIVWQPQQAPDADLNVFVQLLGPAGRPVSELNGPPLGGYAPTSAWRAGESVPDRHALAVPADLPPGSYRLIGGLVNPATGQRMAAGAADFVELGAVDITAGGD